ncbi:MAG: hypothetical protein EHM70_05940 [Chloroflexota bacterium]|nr:MAG: hypothetical protein EHM70_05940 [Chloroflexota bacterium]
MIKFFANAPDNPTTGSLGYAQAILRVNYQYFLTGLVEIQLDPESKFVLLVSEGNQAGAYHIQGNACREIEFSDLPDIWQKGDAAIRSMNLPRESIRAVKEVLEWSPPRDEVECDSKSVAQYLDQYRDENASGLVRVSWPRTEGFVTVWHGRMLNPDTVFSTPNGVEAGAAMARQITNNPESGCILTFYQAIPGTQTYQQQCLRVAVAQWSKGILDRYLQLVGRSLLTALANDLNNKMGAQSWFIQVIGDSIIDTDVFANIAAANQAYTALMASLVSHMNNIIGRNLTNTVLLETYSTLAPVEQETIQYNSLLPVAAVPV